MRLKFVKKGNLNTFFLLATLCGVLFLYAFERKDSYVVVEDNSLRKCKSFILSNDTSENRIDFLMKELNKPESDYIMVVAHRGDWRNAPENSVLALRNAIKMGVDMVEVDVQKTKDGILILMHDETLDRTTNGKGRVEDYIWKDLEKLYLRSAIGGETRNRIPTLEEIMLIAKTERKVLINIDKASVYFKEVGEILKRTGTSNLAVVKSNLDPEEIKSMIHYIDGAHFMPVLHLDGVKDPLKIIDMYIRNFSPKMMEVSFLEDTSLLFKNPEMLTGRGVKIWNTCTSYRWCAKHDDKLAVDFKDPEASWGWLINKGATILMTDRPKELIEYLSAKGFRH